MMKYILSFPNPATQLIEVEIQAVAVKDNPIFSLPQWRPGRYELQRFDKLIADVKADNDLIINRLSTHSWQINALKGQPITLRYVFYANQRDSGSSLFDAQDIYINGCNLFLYQEEIFDAPCEWVMNVPEDYEIACSLKREGNTLYASSFHELIDAPLFAGRNLQHHSFQVENLLVHLWFMGECMPDFQRFEKDITQYTKAQIQLFGDCPVQEYHYLLQMLPNAFRHGVEHQGSSVNTFGPAHLLMQQAHYESFIELLSHEFFHTWNVKYLRPADMYPYNYSQPQYSTLHHVTEGVTSYYGDLMLLKSNLYNTERFLQNLNLEIQDFCNMLGKDHISLEEASFNSWINGYGLFTGIPNRKISFYTKGYIVAFLLDVEIRRNTDNQYSMDDVLKYLYQNIAKKGKGYTKTDYKKTIEQLAGVNMDNFFVDYIEGVKPLHQALKNAAEYMGWHYTETKSAASSQSQWGLYLNGNVVADLHEQGAALEAGLSKGDEIIAIELKKVAASNIESVFDYFEEQERIVVYYFHNDRLTSTQLIKDAKFHTLTTIPQLIRLPFMNSTAEQKWKSIYAKSSDN